MQKAQLYEAILLVNRGIDEAVHGLERLNRAKGSGLERHCFDEKVTPLEIHRASLKRYFRNNVERNEQRDAARFGSEHPEYERNARDEIQLYQELRAIEERPRIEGKPLKVRFFTEEEQRGWERRYSGTSENVVGEAHCSKGRPT